MVFCDGSANQGMCGSAAVLKTVFGESTNSRKVAAMGDNVEAELDGILLAFESVVAVVDLQPDIKRCIIITDCESALKVVLHQAAVTRWGKYLKRIWEQDNSLRIKDVEVVLAWCPSHCGILPNEKADFAAKQACFFPLSSTDLVEVSLEQCKTLIADIIKKKWQIRWNQSSAGSVTRDIIPLVNTKIDFSVSRSCGISMVRALLDNASVNDNLFRMNLVESPDCPDCDRGRQTVDHVLLECEKFSLPRRDLQLSLPRGFNFSFAELLNPSFCLSKSQRKHFYELLHAYFKNISI